MRRRKRRSMPNPDEAGPEAEGGVPTQPVVVTDTGDAHAYDGGTALTGYRGPVPEPHGPSAGRPVQVSRTGDANASGGGTAISGYVSELTVVHQAAPREPASWPHQVGVIPSRAQSFQHRAEVEQLRTAVAGGGTAVLCQVLTGTGGVGKTQLAADYARAAWESGGVDVLVWITASTRSAIVSGYAQAGAEVLGAGPQDPEQAAKTFLAWLEPKPDAKPCRWLVVLDDLAEPVALRGLLPPTSPSGRTLVTTRRRDAALTGPDRRLVTVGLFTSDEAAAYLTTVLTAHHRHEPADELTALAADLGYLPLALAQAAAYLIDSGRDCAAYRQLLADRARTLTDVLPEPDALPDDQATTVAAAWSLSIERADRLRPAGLARPMLQLAAMLDPNGIPAPVLTAPPALVYLTEHRTPGEDTSRSGRGRQVSAQDAADALRCLHRLSLIDHTPATAHQAVRVHNLIQRAVRDSLPADQHDRLARAAADALADAWPEVERDTALARALRANTEALTSQAKDAFWHPHPHLVLYRTGTSLGESGQVTAAITHFQRLANAARDRLGPDHPYTLGARTALAMWRGEYGDAAGTADAYVGLLADYVRVLGEDHFQTLITRTHLALWRGRAGDAAGAADVLAELVADQERVLGPDHPQTLTTRSGLARWRGEAGEAAGAADALAELLEHMVRVLGPDCPDTLAVRFHLARWRGESGEPAGAADAYAGLLADCVRVLGEDHFQTLITRTHLALWRGRAGDAAGAADVLAQLVADQERVLGPDHPDTLTTRNDLARWRGEAGDAAGAADVLAELLADQERVLGEDHPDTLAVQFHLAFWRGSSGDAAGAADTLAKLLADQERVLGEDHPDTLETRSDLALWRGEAGDAAGAADVLVELVADQERVLGPDHLDTLTTRSGLALWLGEAGDAAGAADVLAELLADQERVLGEDHPDTLETRSDLALWRGEAGDAAGAAGILAELVADQERVLGPDHLDTLTTRSGLALWLGEAGDAAGAADVLAELVADQERVLGPDHLDTLTTRSFLAFWRGEAGDAAGAADVLAELLADQERVLGEDHPDTLDTRNDLALWRGNWRNHVE
ncbi:tetratricopeptide repeat protein [Streptomyces sp. NBC_00887]|uniref:tetratricopeptide repeat protein n=1 Tax=Streptomyces sp. NBC_00887 TaxID=2975859 RepID=UPI00386F8ECB|nr:tetratricopeptide repeat protein [Streptomyces sp. NBC_00887]